MRNLKRRKVESSKKKMGIFGLSLLTLCGLTVVAVNRTQAHLGTQPVDPIVTALAEVLPSIEPVEGETVNPPITPDDSSLSVNTQPSLDSSLTVTHENEPISEEEQAILKTQPYIEDIMPEAPSLIIPETGEGSGDSASSDSEKSSSPSSNPSPTNQNTTEFSINFNGQEMTSESDHPGFDLKLDSSSSEHSSSYSSSTTQSSVTVNGESSSSTDSNFSSTSSSTRARGR